MEQSALLSKFNEKYDTHSAMLFRLARVYLGNAADAEDVMQEVFFRLLYKAPNFSSLEQERRWLIRVTVNLCKDCLKSAWRRKVVPLEEELPDISPDTRQLTEAVLALPEKYKAVIHLYYYEGYTTTELAKLLGLTQSAVKMRLKRGRELLRTEMEGDQ